MSSADAAFWPGSNVTVVTGTTNPAPVVVWLSTLTIRPGVVIVGHPFMEQGWAPVFVKTIATVTPPMPATAPPGSAIDRTSSVQGAATSPLRASGVTGDGAAVRKGLVVGEAAAFEEAMAWSDRAAGRFVVPDATEELAQLDASNVVTPTNQARLIGPPWSIAQDLPPTSDDCRSRFVITGHGE